MVALVAVSAGAFMLGRGGEEAAPPVGRGGAPTTLAARTGQEWQALHSAPTARQQVASAVLDGTVWILGGLASEGRQATSTMSTAKAEAYDPAIDTWKTGPDLPLPLHHAAAVAYRDELVVLGGWRPDGNLAAVPSDRVFALRGRTWIELPRLRRPRAAFGAAVVGDKIIVVGGQNDHALVTETEVFDGTSWRDGAKLPTPREHLAVASDDRFVYAVGGRALSSDKNTGALERYDPARDRWSRLPDKPTPSGGLGATVVSGQLVALGGEDPTGVIDAVEAFDLKRRTWSELPPMRTPRHGIGVVSVGISVFAIDGARRPSHASPATNVEALTLR